MVETFAGFRAAEVAGVPVLWQPDARFKTFRVTLHARRPLGATAAARSLLPALLLQGTARDPDRPALARRMESLYGAAVLPLSEKQGETHVLRFTLDSVAGHRVPGQPDLLGDGLALLADLLARPRLAQGGLEAGSFERERRQAADGARAVFNNKGRWAAQRALALACDGEPMAIPEHGDIDAIEALTPAQCEAARRDFLGRGSMFAVAYGDLREDTVQPRVANFLAELPPRETEPLPPPVEPAPRDRRAAVERAHLQQSKLVLVFRLPTDVDASTWAKRGLFCSMLGGGPHSRLFREVREKLSLAYYAHATLDRHKGLLTIHIGLDEGAAERVEEEVRRQVAQLAAGEFTDEEFATARLGILSALQAVDDSIGDRSEFTARQWVLGHDRTPSQHAELYASLERTTIADGAAGLWLDYSYLLAPQTSEGSS
ncbi:MAG: insulinase family protein [Planctomycetota bacterium]